VHTTPTNPGADDEERGAVHGPAEAGDRAPAPPDHLALPPGLGDELDVYLNGSAHRSTAKDSFAGTETRGQLNFATRFMPHASPAVLARGMFGMLAYDASATLKTIDVPVLVVPGDRDPTCTPEASAWMDRDIPKARQEALAPAKHMGLIEHNERFSELVAAFASSCSPNHTPGVAGRSA
jgi:pimeloyl-ACP methyl ester carboxylesterase